ncbi:MAG: hypothetical protein ACKVPX_11735, partial [Myxococcaceae bacterium]
MRTFTNKTKFTLLIALALPVVACEGSLDGAEDSHHVPGAAETHPPGTHSQPPPLGSIYGDVDPVVLGNCS